MASIAIMRHGHAENFATSDRERKLTELGEQGCIIAAQQLCQEFIQQPIEAVYHSPYIRTTESAKLVASHAPSALSESAKQHIVATDELLGNNSPTAVCKWLMTLQYQRILLVSHQPLVSHLLAWLIDGAAPDDSQTTSKYPMRPASLAIVEGDIIDRGCCTLLSHYHPTD